MITDRHKHSGHERGLCWTFDFPHRDTKEIKSYVFVNIPKCASTSMKHWIRRQGGKEANYFDLDAKGDLEGREVFTVVRHPRARFLSAFIEVYTRQILKTPEGALALLAKGQFFDEHVEKQLWFLDGIRIDRFLPLFWLDAWLHHNFEVPANRLRVTKQANFNEVGAWFSEQDMRLIDDIYLEDGRLFRSVLSEEPIEGKIVHAEDYQSHRWTQRRHLLSGTLPV